MGPVEAVLGAVNRRTQWPDPIPRILAWRLLWSVTFILLSARSVALVLRAVLVAACVAVGFHDSCCSNSTVAAVNRLRLPWQYRCHFTSSVFCDYVTILCGFQV